MLIGKLSVREIDEAKPLDGKEYLLGDGGGLHLRIRPGEGKGKKSWVFKYTDVTGNRRKIGLGTYPEVGLAKAREAALGLRQLQGAGKDPKLDKIEKRVTARKRSLDTFEKVAREWHRQAAVVEYWSEGHAHKLIRMLEIHAFPKIGRLPIGHITPPDVKDLLMSVAAATKETAGELRSLITRIYKYAVTMVILLPSENFMMPGAADMRLPRHVVKSHAAKLNAQQVGQLVRDLRAYKGNVITVSCLQLMPLLFQRPGQVRHMQWHQLDLDKGIWNCPPSIMKMVRLKKESEHTEDHVVPLPHQAVEILRRLSLVTGPDGYVFKSPARRSEATKTLSENTVNSALRGLGYDTQRDISGHGFRALARTLIKQELKWDREEIERHLAHVSDEELGDTYDRARYVEQRKVMVQAWANYLDDLANNVPTPRLKLVTDDGMPVVNGSRAAPLIRAA